MSKKQEMLNTVIAAVSNYANHVTKDAVATIDSLDRKIGAIQKDYSAVCRNFDVVNTQRNAALVKLHETEQANRETHASLGRGLAAVLADLKRVEEERDQLKETQKGLVRKCIEVGKAQIANARDAMYFRKEYDIVKLERDTLAFDLDEAQRCISHLRNVPTQSDKGEATNGS